MTNYKINSISIIMVMLIAAYSNAFANTTLICDIINNNKTSKIVQIFECANDHNLIEFRLYPKLKGVFLRNNARFTYTYEAYSSTLDQYIYGNLELNYSFEK